MNLLKISIISILLAGATSTSANELGLSEAQLNSLLAPETSKPQEQEKKKVSKTIKTVPAKTTTPAKASPPKPKKVVPAKNKNTFNCDKKFCKAMKHCSVARYKLEVCGHKNLDRDNDGIPCENICL